MDRDIKRDGERWTEKKDKEKRRKIRERDER